MSLEQFLSQGLALVGTFNPKITIFVFLLCLCGDAFISIPYLLETTFLLAGYQFSKGILSLSHLILLLLAAQIGRQIGALILYHFGVIGHKFFIKFRNRFKILKLENNNSLPLRMISKINISSPFSVAYGRLIGLRIPVALLAAARRKLKIHAIGIAIASIIFDFIFVTFGYVVGATVVLKPIQIILLSVSVLTVIYAITFCIRHFIIHPFKRRKLQTLNNKTN